MYRLFLRLAAGSTNLYQIGWFKLNGNTRKHAFSEQPGGTLPFVHVGSEPDCPRADVILYSSVLQ